MKRTFNILYTITILCFLSQSIYPQTTQPKYFNCTDPIVHNELVSINKANTDNGYQLILMRNMYMPSGGWQPVTVDLEQNNNYQINYVAQKDAKRVTLTILDKDNNTVLKLKARGDHKISTKFSPAISGPYYIILSQRVRGKQEICGAIGILAKK